MNTPVPTRRVQISSGGWSYANTYSTCAVTAHTGTSSTRVTGESHSGTVSGMTVSWSNNQYRSGSGTGLVTLNGATQSITFTIPGVSTNYYGIEVTDWSQTSGSAMVTVTGVRVGQVTSSGAIMSATVATSNYQTDPTQLASVGASATVRYNVNNGYYGSTTGSWGHSSASSISTYDRDSSSGSMSISTSASGYTVSISGARTSSVTYSFKANYNYPSTYTYYEGSGSISAPSYADDIDGCYTNFGSIDYTTSGRTANYTVTASSEGTANIRLYYSWYTSPSYATYVNGYFNGDRINYINFDGKTYP